jgi:hypothetical protein
MNEIKIFCPGTIANLSFVALMSWDCAQTNG